MVRLVVNGQSSSIGTDGSPAPLAPLGGEPSGGSAGEPRQPWYRRSYGRPPRVRTEEVLGFSRQLGSFLEAGIPIVEALGTVAAETGSARMRAVIAELRTAVLRGRGFADAVDDHPTVFPSYYRAMVRSADLTGHLDEVLLALAGDLERDLEARRQVRSALAYPIVVLVLAVVAVVVMALFVFPRFAGMYASLGSDLPLPTQLLLDLTDAVATGWPFMIGALAALVALAHLVLGGERGRSRRDRLVRRLPVIGRLADLVALERFCRVFAALAESGAPLPGAIEVAADSTGNSVYRTRLLGVRDAVVRGSGLSAPLAATGLFPLAARQMIQVGEQTGALGRQLGKAADHYGRQLRHELNRATELFQPVVIVVVGLFVGFVAIAQVAAMYSVFGRIR